LENDDDDDDEDDDEPEVLASARWVKLADIEAATDDDNDEETDERAAQFNC
jgi:hypothetical protein